MHRLTLVVLLSTIGCDHVSDHADPQEVDWSTLNTVMPTLAEPSMTTEVEADADEPQALEHVERPETVGTENGERRSPIESRPQESERDGGDSEVEPTPQGSEENLPVRYGESCHQPGPYPTGAWEMSSPEAEGLDSHGLMEAAAFAADHHSQCLIVARHGKIVGEWYWGVTGPSTHVKSWSVAKSYASTVAGIAISRGELDGIDTPVHHHVPEWEVDGKDEVTIRHLLAMSSGLRFDLIGDNIGILLSKNMTQRAIDTPQVTPPGALWEYNNHTVQMIEPVLREATGMAPDAYAQLHLFEPLGMDATWKRDKAGQPAMYMNVKASCRDHLRFGYLFLRRGCWDGTQIIDEAFVQQATQPSTTMNRGYGYWWWLNGQMPTLNSVDFTPKTQMLQPGVPPDAFCALGLGNQIVEVIPSLDMVIVRFGPAPQENLALWAMQDGAVMDGLLNDDVQHISYGTVKRVVDSLLD